MPDPDTVDEVMSWLRELDPITRARRLAVLLDTNHTSELSAMRVEAVYEATRTATHAQVATALGVSPSAVNKAVTQHRKTLA